MIFEIEAESEMRIKQVKKQDELEYIMIILFYCKLLLQLYFCFIAQQMYYDFSTLYNQELNQVKSPTPIYFPFGEERERIKSYVFQKLHGEDTIKHEQILKKFREDATIRKQKIIHRHTSPNEYQLDKLQEAYQAFSPAIAQKRNNQMRYASYSPNQFSYYPIIPANKTPPPIYRMKTLEPIVESNKKLFSPKNRTNKSDLTIPIQTDHKRQQIQKKHKSVSKRRSLSLEVKESFKDQALGKIKEVARKRRNINLETINSFPSTDSSQIIDQLESKQQEVNQQHNKISKQLKRLKKYRNYAKLYEQKYQNY